MEVTVGTCPVCGCELAPRATVCPLCGAALSGSVEKPDRSAVVSSEQVDRGRVSGKHAAAPKALRGKHAAVDKSADVDEWDAWLDDEGDAGADAWLDDESEDDADAGATDADASAAEVSDASGAGTNAGAEDAGTGAAVAVDAALGAADATPGAADAEFGVSSFASAQPSSTAFDLDPIGADDSDAAPAPFGVYADGISFESPVSEKSDAERYSALTQRPEIKHAPPSHGKHGKSPHDQRRPKFKFPRGKKLAALIVGCVALVVVIVVAAIAISSAYSSDANLKERADAAKRNSSSASVSLQLPSKTDEGNYATNIAGKGLIASDANARYFAMSNGVYRQQGNVDSDLEKISADSASYLNLRAGNLYYVSSSTAVSGKSGSSASASSANVIKACKPGETSLVIYQAPEGSTISYLSLWDETMYFVVSGGGTSTLYQLPISGGEAKQLLTKQCRKMSAFVETGKLYAITINDNNWTAQRASLGSSAITFQSWGSGSGSLQGVCVSNGALLYSKKGGHVIRLTATGEMKEISETSDAPLVLASTDTLFAFESDGQLHMASTSLGLLNDSVDAVDGWLGQQVAADLSAGIADGMMYVSTTKGTCVVCDLANGTVNDVKVGA